MQTHPSTRFTLSTSVPTLLGLGFLFMTLFTWCPKSQAALAAYWNYDEGSGTIAHDISGNTNNHDGTLVAGAELPAWVPGRFGTALGFSWQIANNPGSGKRVTVPFHNELLLNGPFTISYWYRMDAATPAGTFPGIMRIGSQSAVPPAANVGWGFFRTTAMVHKRGNVQPAVTPAITVGLWSHLALRYNGSNSTIAYVNGTPFVTNTTSWSTNNTTTVFEMGRMDAFDQATLDDLALWWNEAIPQARIRSLYTAPTAFNLDYSLNEMRVLWNIFDGGPGTSNTIKGTTWSYAATVPGSTVDGDAYISGGSMYIVLGSGAGVSAPLTLIIGSISPGGIGTVGSFSLVGKPVITVSNANVLYDLNSATTPGAGVNDLIDVNGDLNFVNSSISIDPLTQLAGGVYRLFNYTGTKTGSPTILNTTRYSLALDQATAGQVNLSVSGSTAGLRWSSPTSSAWDLITSNWVNTSSSSTDTFFQGDSVLFDESGTYQANITVASPVFPKSITVNSSNRTYNISGAAQIGGVGGGLLKGGASMLVLATPNTFIGDVQVAAGMLRLGNPSALGTTNGSTTVATGATLDLAGNSPGFESINVQGAGLGSTGAVINTGAALVNNGLLGRVVLNGDTTFGGINRWDVFGGTLVGNGFKLTKIGAPEIALSNLGNTGLGDIDIQAGILTILGSTGMGDPTKTVTVAANAVLAFWQIAPNVLNKPVVLNSAILRNATSGGTDIATNLGTVTINGDANIQATANIALLGTVQGTGNVVKVNTGTLYLGGTNTYTGRTTISAGTLAVLATGSLSTTPRIDVQSGTTFDVSRLSGGFTLATNQTLSGSGFIAGSLTVGPRSLMSPGTENIAATLAVSGNLTLAGGTNLYELAAATTEGAGVNDLITIGGNLTLTGVSTISINPIGLLTVGNTYTLFNYTGTLTGNATNLVVVSNSRYSFLVSTLVPGKITLTVSAGMAADLVWFGETPGAENLWDLKTTPNWSDGLGMPSTFYGGDKVSFDDFAAITNINLVGSLTPASIQVDNGMLDYTFMGSGRLSGNSGLTKTFNAKLSIINTGLNDYVGPTTIQGGTLQVGNGGTIGNIGSGPITNNATLVFSRSDTLTVANTIVGTGNIIKSNANLLVLPTANSNYSGTFTAAGGTIRPGVSNGLGNTLGGTIIQPGATLDINAINLADEQVTVGGAGVGGNGAIINGSGTGQNNALRFVTLTANTTVGGTGRWDIRANPTASLSTSNNPFTLTKVGANQVSLVDALVDPALGDINVNAGIFSVEVGTTAGDPTKTLTLASGATLQFFGRTVPWDKIHVLNGTATILNASGDTTMNGPIMLNGTSTFNIGGSSLTVNSSISGTGALTKATGAGSLILKSDNTFPGTTTISAGALYLGSGTNAGSLAGPIVDNATLGIYRSDTYTLTNTLGGSGSLSIRSANGVILGSTPVNLSGTVSVGHTNAGRLILPPGLTATWGNLFLGDSPNIPGEVFHLGGDVTVSSQLRVGHWPNNTSSYLMGGGTLTLTAIPAAIVNQAGVAEQNGILYLGIDGTGLFTQTGGVARAHGIVLDGRGNTAGTDTFSLYGGRFIVGPSGLKSGSLDANTTYAINLGGGTLASSATWTSTLAMTLIGTNGNATIDTSGFTNVLSGPLSGIGGLLKIGAGTLLLSGTNNYLGGTVVTQGILVVRGPLGSGSSSVMVQNATLAGDGLITDAVAIQAGGTLAPGFPLGRLTISNSLSLAGTTVMEISKSGTNLLNDAVTVGSSLTYGGNLTVVASGDPLAQGDTFKLFDAGSFGGSFASMTLPPPPPGLSWDLSRLAVDGTIRLSGLSISASRASYNGANFTLSFPSTTGSNYLVQYKDSLNDSNWTTLATIPGDGTVKTVTDTEGFNAVKSGQFIFAIGADQEVPTGGGRTGAGTASVLLSNNVIYVNAAYSGLSTNATAAHFHAPAGRGTNASVLYPLPLPPASKSGTIVTNFPLVVNPNGSTFDIPTQVQQINGSLWYLNIHTATFGGGEIRGQVHTARRFYRVVVQ